jgi:hypothetical protein
MGYIWHICIETDRLRGKIYRVVPLMLVTTILGLSTAAHANGLPLDNLEGRSFSLYVLSRGKGVPDETWRVLKEMRKMFASLQADGVVVRIHEERVGLEGERRLCAEFIDEIAARKAWSQAKEIAAGIELVNLRAEPCTR